MKRLLPLCTLSALLLTVSGRAAQNVNASYSAPTRQTAAEVEDIGEISETAGDGKSTPEATPSHFRFNIGTRAQYTSNAQLHGDNSSSDVIFFPTIEAGFNTKFGRNFSFDSVARIEQGTYADHGNRDFIGYSLQNTLDYRPKANLPRIFIGAEPYRYDSFDHGMITEAIALSAGTDYGYGFNNGNSLLFVGFTFTDHIADPEKDSRRAYTALAGVTHTFRPQLYGQLFYQYEYSDFYNYSRDDSRNLVTISLTYQFNRRLFGTVSGNFVDNNSSDSRASYQSLGASLGLNYQF